MAMVLLRIGYYLGSVCVQDGLGRMALVVYPSSYFGLINSTLVRLQCT